MMRPASRRCWCIHRLITTDELPQTKTLNDVREGPQAPTWSSDGRLQVSGAKGWLGTWIHNSGLLSSEDIQDVQVNKRTDNSVEDCDGYLLTS